MRGIIHHHIHRLLAVKPDRNCTYSCNWFITSMQQWSINEQLKRNTVANIGVLEMNWWKWSAGKPPQRVTSCTSWLNTPIRHAVCPNMLDRLEMARVRVARNFISFIEITADMQLSSDVVNSRRIKRSTRAVNQLTNVGRISWFRVLIVSINYSSAPHQSVSRYVSQWCSLERRSDCDFACSRQITYKNRKSDTSAWQLTTVKVRPRHSMSRCLVIESPPLSLPCVNLLIQSHSNKHLRATNYYACLLGEPH